MAKKKLVEKLTPVYFTKSALVELKEALDSHIYWQLSDPKYRNDGFVYGKGSDDPENRKRIKACEKMISRLESLIHQEEVHGGEVQVRQ